MQHASNTPRVTLKLNGPLWDRITTAANLVTEGAQALALGVSRTQISRIRNGHCAPGAEFIAAARQAFPAVDTDELFEVVRKSA
jgi:hypothetical protein